MAFTRENIVTLSSMSPANSLAEAEAAQELEAQGPEVRLKIARYNQVMERLAQETEEVGPDLMITVQDREVSLTQSRIAIDSDEAQPLPSGGQEVKFGTGFSGGDWLRWMLSVTDWVDRQRAHPIMRPRTAEADSFPNQARVGMAADWGTGLYGAPEFSNSIRRIATERPFELLLHLGDVYYSGTEEEIRERFLKVWPTEAARMNRALNSNHEMYSGGFGYFTVALPAFGQASSYFALRNDHWLLVGLDTAYVDHDIDNEQVAWLSLVMNEAKVGSQRKAVLFSHQQPFSRLDSQGPKLQKALRHLLDDQLVTAWYWGHEHECVIYDAHPKWNLLGRCLGNGGIPSVRKSEVKNAQIATGMPREASCTWRRLEGTPDSPGCVVLDGPNIDMKKPADQQKFVPHGFMTLEFNGPELTEEVFLSRGAKMYSNTIR